VRTRASTACGNRLPEDADPPTDLQVRLERPADHAARRRGRLRSRARCARWRRTTWRHDSSGVDGVAASPGERGPPRQIHVELSKEKITALNLSVASIVQTLQNENQNTPLGEIYQGRRVPSSSAVWASSRTSRTSGTSSS
jgi:multidrug efflux pump subunit AcrB